MLLVTASSVSKSIKNADPKCALEALRAGWRLSLFDFSLLRFRQNGNPGKGMERMERKRSEAIKMDGCFGEGSPIRIGATMRNLNPLPIALLLSGSILLIVGLKSGGGMGRIESIGGESFMLVGLLWIAAIKFRSK